ncbi:hypothetical protein BDW74DRAFT_170450 [Aspergillus multicolor]|uniref:uncharacterized protein n=1 Tax=Aspergillus multicolor TaxID=41759 RepID=UPI003CCD39D7
MSSYTLDQVKAHCTPEDVWIIFHNKVYDVTKYLEDHPGGSAVLIEVAGADATEAFEEVGHSDEAREQLEPFYIGDLPDEEHTESVEVYKPTFEQVSQSAVISTKTNKISSPLKRLLRLALAGFFGAAAVAIHQRCLSPSGLRHALTFIPSSTSFPKGFAIGQKGSQFWSGVGIASVAQLSLSLGLGIWASTKLDVQQEFTHYPARRAASKAQLLRLHRASKMAAAVPSSSSGLAPVLDPRQWRSFVLTSKKEVAPNVYRLIFALPNEDDILRLPTGQHVALRAVINGKTVQRSYTPISNNADLGHIELLIKVYPAGLLTNHLKTMEIGDKIEMRGPKGAMKYSDKYARRIGMVAGGTGITPMYQLIRAICEDPLDKTQVSLLYANNSEADILLREELEGFAARCPEKFKMEYVLSHPDESWKGYSGFVNADMITKHIGPSASDAKVLLCGPPPMVEAMKKMLVGMGWDMPGAIAKGTDQVFLF